MMQLPPPKPPDSPPRGFSGLAARVGWNDDMSVRTGTLVNIGRNEGNSDQLGEGPSGQHFPLFYFF